MNPRSWFKDLTPYFIYLLFISTLGPALFGYHIAELNAPQDVITCTKKSISTAASLNLPQCIPMNPTEIGLVSSIFTLGGLIGALGAGPFSASYGRLKTMLGATPLFIVGAVFEALAINIPFMVVGRFISGLGAGVAVVAVPIYISEIAPPHEKGFFGAFTQVMINFGIFITQLLGYFLSKGQYWRIILGVGGAIGVLQAIGLAVGGAESPKWMADQGMPSMAKRVLRRMRGHAADIEEEVQGWGVESGKDLDEEEQTLLTNEDHMSTHSSSDSSSLAGSSSSNKGVKAIKRQTLGVFAILRHPDTSPAVIAVVGVMVAQQLCGINSIVMYGVSLLSDLLAANSALLNVAVAAVNTLVTIAFAPLLDKIGRKTCLLLSITGMGINSLLLAIGIGKHIPVLSAVAVLLFVASFGLGLGPVPFILSSELVSPEAVGATQSWALAANWIATFVVAQFFPMVNAKLGEGRVYYLFFAMAVLFGGFVAWWVPETKGKSDIDEIWGRKGRVRDD
ncbi:Bifunctional purine biosynthesis protein PurH [Elasticomyces elasticus]|nr:Bifunctional purine biosynthesis protein PurH [Elasticomyces elasticus]KAK4996526.1 Bifunctional purine biosynthesis protein PurH [Elasticomyces elasticus]